MEDAILAAEEEAGGLEGKLNSPEFQAAQYGEIPALLEKLDAAKAEVARLYARWEELDAIRSSAEPG